MSALPGQPSGAPWCSLTFSELIKNYASIQSKLTQQVKALASNSSTATPGKFLLNCALSFLKLIIIKKKMKKQRSNIMEYATTRDSMAPIFTLPLTPSGFHALSTSCVSSSRTVVSHRRI